jgi:hypothetical protein
VQRRPPAKSRRGGSTSIGPAARRMASISSSDSLSMGEASRCGRGPGLRPWRPHRVDSLAPRPPGRGAFLKPPSSRPRTRLAGGSNSQATDWMTMPAAAVVLAASPDRPRQSPAAQAPPRRSPDREDCTAVKQAGQEENGDESEVATHLFGPSDSARLYASIALGPKLGSSLPSEYWSHPY